jgi:hypothetical protein
MPAPGFALEFKADGCLLEDGRHERNYILDTCNTLYKEYNGTMRYRKMVKKTDDYQTITVTGSFSAARPDGRYAIVLDTLEAGPIALEVNDITLKALRRELNAIEAMMKQPGGNA